MHRVGFAVVILYRKSVGRLTHPDTVSRMGHSMRHEDPFDKVRQATINNTRVLTALTLAHADNFTPKR